MRIERAVARRAFGAAALALLMVAACDPAPSPNPNGSAAPSSSTVPTRSSAASALPGDTVAGGLRLAEVRFAPLAGDPQFIEIANAAAERVDPVGTSLDLGGTTVGIPAGSGGLGPGERLLVQLDGAKEPSGHTIHLAGTLGTAGVIRLLDAAGSELDRVAWGLGQASAMTLTRGDMGADTIETGSTIGRAPGANDAFQPIDWVVYSAPLASPGSPNPVPPVAVLLPIDGAIIDANAPLLEWDPVLGATGYRVEVATDDTFSRPVVAQLVTEPQLALGSLAPGRYLWHVQSIGSDGTGAAVSESSAFELEAPVATIELARSSVPRPAGQGVLAISGVNLAVPWLNQHKDTTMLLLEEPHEAGLKAWDRPHVPGRRDDPADQMNCALAMIAMVNHFYGGDLSQDRIGFELLKDRQPGPEQDLMYGGGLDVPQSLDAFTFAIGARPTYVAEFASYDDLWAELTASIDAGRPLPAAGPHHGYVIRGYAIRNGHRVMTVNDPARATPYEVDLDAAKGNSKLISAWRLPPNPVGRKQEPSVTKDSDGDGVVDFDETERFQTNPNAVDSDADGVHDKQDVASGIFEPTFGYAADPGGPGRDFDSDSIPTERDADSDSGGCPDGAEDKNGDGHRNGKESWNFDPNDDVCGDLVGTLTWTDEITIDSPDNHSRSLDTIVLNVRFDERDGEWVDAGSSYAWQGSSVSDHVNKGDDPEHFYCGYGHSTETTTGGGPFTSSLASTINVTVDPDARLVEVSAWVAGLLQSHSESGSAEARGADHMSCYIVTSDATQGGGTTLESQAEWGRIPACDNTSESIDGTIATDGRTVAVHCTKTETTNPQPHTVAIDTITLSGTLILAKH